MKNTLIEKEDFCFRKNKTSNDNKTVKQVVRYSLLFLLVLGATYNIHNTIQHSYASSSSQQITLQDLHTIKELSTNLVSQLSFSDKNANTVLYQLEVNPAMNLQAYQSVSEFFIKKRKNNTKFEFSPIKDSPSLYTETSFIQGKKSDTITVPVIQTETDLTTNNTVKSYSLINFTYEVINNKYVLKNIY